MRRAPKLLELNALSITLFYFVFAVLWILLSDQLLIWITNDPLTISKYQTIKGLLYVLCTTGFLYYLINLSNDKISREKNRIDKALFAANMATWSIDLKSEEIARSEFHHKLFGFKKKPQTWGLKNFLSLVHPDDRARVQKELDRAINKEKRGYEVEYRIIWPDESIRWMTSRGNLIYDNTGTATRIAGVIADITEQKELEEEHARDKELFERIFEQIPVMVDIYDPEINSIRVNQAFEKTLGWSNKEIREIDLLDACYPDPKERQRAAKVMSEADGKWYTFEVMDKYGNTHIQEWSNIQLSDNSIIGIGLDITESKIAEEKIRESRELLQKTFESLKESVIILDPETRTITDCNKGTTEMFGYSADELIGKTTEILHVDKEHFIEFGDFGKEDFEANGFFQTEYIMKKKDGRHFYSDHTVTYVKDEDGNPEKVVSVIRDITDKKKQQKRLQELTDRYRKAEEIASIGHWEQNIKTDEAIWSEGFYNIIGLEPGEQDNSYQSLLEMIHPEDREQFDSAFKNALETGSLDVRYRLIKPSTQEVGYYHELGETSYDENGNPETISGTIQDMTELEKFQIELYQRNKFIETTLDNLPIGVAVNKIDSGEATLMNSKFSEIYGWPKEVLKDIPTFFEKVYPAENYRSKMIEMINADIASEDSERMHWKGVKITTQTGEERIINAKNIPVYDQDLMISTVVDVTAQFKAEQRLAESEHNYRLLFQQSPSPMWIYNPDDLRFIEVNNAAMRHYGYSRKEFQEMTILDIRPEEDREALRQEVQKRTDDKLSDTKEWRHLKKNGDVIYVNITGSEIDYFGNSYRLVLVNDVTEQKKAEEMVLASLVEGENKERARIARELHDGLGQYLAAANMNLDSVLNDIDKLTDRKQEQFKKGLNLLRHAVSETAQISRNLLPRVVDDYGLALAIESLVDNYSNNTETKITYYQNIDNLDLERKIELNLYRIAQEAISNAVKYSEATQINVQLIQDELDLILSIDDNGKGFDSSTKDFTPGLGLQTIKTRTGALGGEFELDTKPGKGTFIHIIVPIKNKIEN